MFREASSTCRKGSLKDIEPFWVYEGSSAIERHLPFLPLSREADTFRRLKKSLAAYRLVFGQPRQEDLLAYLHDKVKPEDIDRLVDDLRVDLSPR